MTGKNEELIDEELEHILQSFFEDALESQVDTDELIRYESEWTRKLRKLVEEDLFNNLFPKYFLFVAKPDLWKRYILKALNSSIQWETKNVLAMWQNPFVLLGVSTEITEGCYQISEVLGHKTYTVELEDIQIEEGGLVFGIAFPDNRVYEDGIILLNAQMIIPEATESLIEIVMSMAEESGETASYAFFKKHMVDVYKALFEWQPDEGFYDAKSFEMTHSEVAVITEMNEVLMAHHFHAEDIELAERMALVYLQEEPVYRKEAVIASAVVQAIHDFAMFQHLAVEYTQKEIAGMFGVSVGSMMNHVEKIDELILKMLEGDDDYDHPGDTFSYQIGTYPEAVEALNWELFCKMETVNLDEVDDIELYLNEAMAQPFEPKNNEQKAQAMIYEAYAVESFEEKSVLAKQAKMLNPKNADVFLIEAEIADDANQADLFFQKAIELGSESFDDRVEIVWALVTNRPYLRAIFSYGVWLYERNRFEEAVEQFETLLTLCEEDSLNARHLAIASYIRLGDYRRAQEILDFYEGISDEEAPDLFLQWQLEMARTNGQSKMADELYEEAFTENIYVETIIGSNLPRVPYPVQLTIEAGSMEEAMYIWILIGD